MNSTVDQLQTLHLWMDDLPMETRESARRPLIVSVPVCTFYSTALYMSLRQSKPPIRKKMRYSFTLSLYVSFLVGPAQPAICKQATISQQFLLFCNGGMQCKQALPGFASFSPACRQGFHQTLVSQRNP